MQIKDLLDRLRGSLLFPLAVILDRQTEISNLNYILGIDEDVERFEISVDDVLTVDIFNALNNLRKVMEVELPVNLTSQLKDSLQGLGRAQFHLDHDVKSEVILLILNEMTYS